jgi:hypothetical protein
MDQNSLREHAAKLHAEMTAALAANPESKQALSAALPEVHALSNTADSLPHATLPNRLESLAVQFEADHPTLAASARRLVELLAEVGI